MTKVPVTINSQTLSAEMAAKAGPKAVRAVATVRMPADAEGLNPATRFVLILDCSYSTNDPLTEGAQINTVMRQACCGIIDLMGDQDEICVIQFDNDCNEQDVLCEPLTCTVDGKAEAQMAVNSISPRGGTIFAAGLNRGSQYLHPVAGKNLVLIFVSDGENGGGQDPVEMCNQFRTRGVMVYTACINNGAVGNSGEKLLSAMAEDKYFKSANNPQEVVSYFGSVLKSAQKAAITDARVEFRPIKTVNAINQIEMVEKNGVSVYVPGAVSSTTGRLIGNVKIDQVGPGDTIAVHLSFNVTTKDFPAGFTKEGRSFGRVVLIGSCKSAGVDNTELASCDMEVTFSANPARVQNKGVQRVIGIADGARAMYEVSQTSDTGAQRKILRDAAGAVRGTMALTGDDPTLQAVLAGLGNIETATDKGGDAAAQAARSGTQVLRADDADAALAGL